MPALVFPLRWFYRLLLAMALLTSPVMAQTRAALTTDSRITIRGTSSVNAFTCTAGSVDGSGTFRAGERGAQATLTVPVAAFDCGNPHMNRDLQQALQADRHPQIRFVLDRVVLREDAPEGRYPLQADGRLTIAGSEQPVTLNVEGRRLPDGTYRATGSVGLRMTTFGIAPPTALLGLIRVRDAITVEFDLVATLTPLAY